MSRLIEVLVSPTGETKLETRGFTGAACQQATQALAAALGLAVSETLTAEYYQPAEQQAGVTTQTDR